MQWDFTNHTNEAIKSKQIDITIKNNDDKMYLLIEETADNNVFMLEKIIKI